MKLIYFSSITVFILTFLMFTKSAEASIITIKKDGTLIWNVLSAQDSIGLNTNQASDITVSKPYDNSLGANPTVSLLKQNGKISLVLSNDKDKKELEISASKEDVVEVEERPQTQKITLGTDSGKFSLKQPGITALTDFPLTVDSKDARLSVKTGSGDRYLTLMPIQALQSLLRAGTVNVFDSNTPILLEENLDGQLVYKIPGKRSLNIFNVYNYQVEVNGSVSALTGQILNVEEPIWLKLFGFIFS